MAKRNKDEQAQDQADANESFARSMPITTEDGPVFQVRNPLFFNAKQLKAYSALHYRINHADRWPDRNVPEQRMVSQEKDGTKVETFVGAHVQRGDFIEPYQETDEHGTVTMIDPPYEIQMSMIVLGDEYEQFEESGGSPRELVELLKQLREGVANRVDADPKSVGSPGVLEAGPETDSQ